uniref:Transmembrane protease serine 11G n=1 Tax=Bactrocera dorsalis TaxID=27457 RepID=A0A034V349_BACDO
MIEVKMISKLWLLICATHIVIIKGTYDPALNGIKTRNYHRTYPNAEQEPHINSQSYEPRPISNGNYGAGSVRLSPTNSYPHYDGSRTEQQPSHSHQHQHAVGQQQHQKQTAQQTASYQQRELPLFNRNAHVRHSTPTQRSERRESVLSSGLESTIPDFDTGCPPQHTGPVPYAYDCRRFVNCWHGRGHIQSCGPGTVFNPETLECDRPDKVVCGGALTNGERREQQATLHSAPQQNKYRAGRLIDASTDSVRDLCPNGFSGLAPHPNDCTKFLNCANGNTHVQNCGPGTAFSASKKVCDFKENVDCGDRENSAYGAVNNRDSRQYANLNYVDTNVQQNTLGRGEEKEEGDIFCPLGVSGHFPYPFDYTKFINCKNGNTAIQNCVPNTAYSISRNYCESKEKVPRTDHVAYIVSEVRYEYSLTIVSCPPSTDGLHLYPYDFTKYISCQQEHMNIVACGPKYVFSISRRECLPETQVNIADRVRNAWELRHNVESTDSHNVHGNNPNANYQPPPTQSNYRDSTQNGWRQQHHEHGSSSQRTANDRQTYGNGVPTTSTQTGSYGDRWSNMDVQRPIASDMTYGGAYSADRQQRLPTHGRELQQHGSSNNWIASGSAIDRQTPTQSVIYEEGSLQPNREQHSLTTVPTQNSTHETRTEFYSKNTRQESKTNSNWHNHGHSREFHRKHPNLLDPFNEDDHTSTHTHHRHNHNRAYHQRHPEIPNPFITPETPQTTTNFELSNNNLPNPHAENTTPFSVRPRIDVRGEDINCQFDCGNGNCVKSHEVCNGINNCGNRKDEEDCKHLGYEVRLTGGESLNMGRIEVKVLGKWGYVCDDKFGLSDAEVVCRELGFKLGASEVRGFSYYPPTTVDVSFAMDEVECRGNETSLKECSFKGWGVSNCGPDEVVGVVCKVPQLKCPNNYWLCSTSQECIPPAFVCDNTPDCADKSDESETVCNSPIKYRLEGGRSPNEGRLEVRYRGEWGTVCDDDFGLKEARVMCNSMGFYGTPTIVKNKYGSGNGPIWLDQVSCYGNETTLDQCGHFTWGEHNCNHTEDVGLKCTLGAPPQKENSSPQLNDFENTQRELDDTQQQLEDIGLYSEQWERKSKAVGDQRRCGQFKNNLLDEFAHPEERVVNGSIAKRGHHPWQATIRTRGRGGISSHWCGAVLISSRHLLTAAHCLAGYPKGAYLVRMGDHYANIAESSEVDSFIENWYIHEKFRDGSHMNNDIAVIVLKTPVRFNDYIQPVCLPNKGAALAENRLCTISGWGSIKSGVSTPSNILRAAELPILSDEVCKQKHVYGASLTEGMFCAGYMDESSDACDGDSGGPLICHDEDGETLYGIISWGQHCGYANKPGVYVRVEKYVDWILEKINISIQNKL